MISREPKICSNQLLSLPVRTSQAATHPSEMKAEETLSVEVGADEVVTAGATVVAEVGTIKTALEGDVEATTEVASIAKGLGCPATLASWVLKATPVWEAAPKMEHSTNHGNQCVSTLTMMILLSSMVKVKDWTWASSQPPSRAKSRCSKPNSRCSSKCFTTSRVARTGLARKLAQEAEQWAVETDSSSATMTFSEARR